MFAKKRLNKISEYLKTKQSATVSELSDEFDVSEVTIRKDLSLLESESLIERSFGGAIWIGQSISHEIANEVKMVSHKKEKRAIAEKVISEINEGDTLFLDAGTTNNILIDYIKDFSNLTILTNDLLIALKLTDIPDFRIVFIGGEISNVSKATIDYMATKMLLNFNVDLAILGCDSFSIESGACTTSVDKATLKSTAISIASKSILSATSDKYYRRGLVKFAELNEFDKIYTDDSFNDSQSFKELDDVAIDFKEIN